MLTKKPWFKAKRFGWGWYPVTWQGWLVIVLWIPLVVWFARNIVADNMTTHSVSDFLIRAALKFLVLVVPLLIVCYATGEKPSWHWGNTKK
jgi:hypothetical protein